MMWAEQGQGESRGAQIVTLHANQMVSYIRFRDQTWHAKRLGQRIHKQDSVSVTRKIGKR